MFPSLCGVEETGIFQGYLIALTTRFVACRSKRSGVKSGRPVISCNLASSLLAADGSVGIRLTCDPFCLKLMKLTGTPIVSTSANISGDPSPAIFAEIAQVLHKRVDHIVHWRRQEEEPSTASRILKIEKDGTLTTLRP